MENDVRELLEFEARLKGSLPELWEHFERLYGEDQEAFDYFTDMLRRSFLERKTALRQLDEKRLRHPDWYRSGEQLGMVLYPDLFAGNLTGVREKLPYLEECGVTFLHLMPLLDSPPGKSDGGYAVSDYRKVRPDLGTMEDLEALADACHDRDIALCLDFVMNHTSEEHPWARAARAGDPVARSRYFFYDNWDIPNVYEQTVPQVFPTTAPGNFTYLPDCQQVVMTFFYPFQWDLNYRNPMVLNDMTENLLYLCNRGMDVIRLDAVPYIWKELGTNCRNLPQVHTLTRIMRMACGIVCPGVLLLGEVVMEPKELAPYFGEAGKTECDMLYNATTMCTTWHTLATRDVRLLRHQTDQVSALPKNCLFLNYLRCHDDIGWGLDYPWLRQFGMEEVPHKKYLNDWFTGKWPGSWARGELYNDDPTLGDARLCGTTASLCGIEAGLEQNGDALERGLRCCEMLHAFLLSQSGLPLIYSGDEVCALNDYSYHQSPDPEIREDSRNVHRGKFPWDLAERRLENGTLQNRFFPFLRKMESLRQQDPLFSADAEVRTLDTGSDQVLALERRMDGRRYLGLFNFCEEPREVFLPVDGMKNMCTGTVLQGNTWTLEGYGFRWLLDS